MGVAVADIVQYKFTNLEHPSRVITVIRVLRMTSIYLIAGHAMRRFSRGGLACQLNPVQTFCRNKVNGVVFAKKPQVFGSCDVALSVLPRLAGVLKNVNQVYSELFASRFTTGFRSWRSLCPILTT